LVSSLLSLESKQEKRSRTFIANAGNKEVLYSIYLEGKQEIYPEDYFRHHNHKEGLRKLLREKAGRGASDYQLQQIIEEWIRHIQQGNREILIYRDLEPEKVTIPKPDFSAIKPPPKPIVTESTNPLNPQPTPLKVDKSNSSILDHEVEKEPEESPPPALPISTTNVADF
jgi:hypothetical protein